MRTIYKYAIPNHGGVVELPQGVQILSVGCQGLDLFMWASVETDNPLIEKHMVVMGTGWNWDEVARPERFIGTTQNTAGLIWHVFEGVTNDK